MSPRLNFRMKSAYSGMTNHMTPPLNTKIYDGELASFWFDEDGILCAVSKKVPRTMEKQKANYALVREITGNKRVCLLADNTDTYTQDDITRKYSAQEMPELFKAMAVISRTAIARAASHLFLYFHGEPIPIKSFDNEKEAKAWLKPFLDQFNY
jgi:hypothetical protein